MAPPTIFEIVVTNGDTAFNPGCFVTGMVVIQTSRRKKLLAIRLLLHGNSYVNPVRNQPGETNAGKVVVGRHLGCTVNLWGGDGGERFLEPGSYQFPFAVKLPLVTLPSSFESTAGAVRYWLEARMEKTSRTYFARKPFTIQELVDLNVGHENLFLSRREESRKTFSGLGRRSGPLILTASTDRSGYCPGERILVSTHLDNNSGKEVKKVKATLFCRMTYLRSCQDPHPHVTDTIVCRLRMCQSFGAGRHLIWDRHPLTIPAAILPSSHTSAIIHTDYMLVVKLSMPALLEDVCLILPIVIGTESLRPHWGSVSYNSAVCPPYEACAISGPGRLGSTARPVSWAGPPNYSVLALPTAGPLVVPSEAPPRYTPHATPLVGSSPQYPQAVAAEHRRITEPQAPPGTLSITSPPLSSPVSLGIAPPQASQSVTPSQVSASTVTSPQALTSPTITPPQVSTSSVTPPQVSTSSVTPSQVSTSSSITPPQISTSLSFAPPPVSTSSVTPPQVSTLSVTPPPVSALSVTPPPVSTLSVTPPPVSTLTVTPPPVSTSSVTPPQVSASSVTSPQVSASSVTPPQVNMAESPNTHSHPVSSPEVSSPAPSIAAPPQVSSDVPQISPQGPQASRQRSQRSATFSWFSARRRSCTRAGYTVFVNASS